MPPTVEQLQQALVRMEAEREKLRDALTGTLHILSWMANGGTCVHAEKKQRAQEDLAKAHEALKPFEGLQRWSPLRSQEGKIWIFGIREVELQDGWYHAGVWEPGIGRERLGEPQVTLTDAQRLADELVHGPSEEGSILREIQDKYHIKHAKA